MIILQLSELIAPTELTTGLAILIFGIMALVAYLGYRMRHAAIFFFWFIIVATFILVILIELDFLWFWVAVLATAVAVAVAAIFRYAVEPMLND